MYDAEGNEISLGGEMCNRVVWLENHTVKMFGDVKEVCDAYRL